MLKSKALDIIKTFSKEEFRRFEYFTQSPYFNSSSSIIRLVNELKKYYPGFNSDKMSEESIYAKVYGNGKYSYSAMKNLMSELILVCDKFLVNERFNKNFFLKGNNTIELLEEYRERKLDKLFAIKSKKFEDDLKKVKIDNDEYFIACAYFEILKYRDLLNKHRHNQLIYKGFMNRASNELCRVFQLLYTSTDMLIHSSELLGGNPQESIMLKFIKHLNLQDFIEDFSPEENEKYFFIDIYSRLILMTINDDKDAGEKYYFQIKESLSKKLKRVSNEHIYDIVKSLRSFAINRMRAGKANFIDELLDIDKFLIEKVDYSSDGIKWYIGELFSEIVQLCAHKKDYKYAENFIKKFKNELNDEIRDYEIGWSTAFLYLEHGDVEKALEMLSKIKPVNAHAKIYIKNLYLRAYFDLGYYDEALSIMDAYRHFINNKKIFSHGKNKYFIDQLNLFSTLFKIKFNPLKYSGYDLDKLKNDINQFYFLAGKDWYLDKVKQLGKLVK